ncbi:unnamed protein product (macronuclear) [Paramecium tetraurelia]|uniref:Uncharacterized protein n=1 Tax=Paramecium tetraurelia TaxID=5888 RepID=A0BBL0_PARTE|nr:uncharacterized protein GSPATT00000362001 [Paramecium tetraurelia]CAK55927.1 unnamed protein product [Paramecium tetraurelia]|eukprot:XP_001423325.1 hypothetical protein (macronuclear) [Paramecium tetraurelia strain d4-2]
MSEELNSSLDSLELDLYHKPNPKIKTIIDYLRAQNIRFCTDPKAKEYNYYSSQSYKQNNNSDFGMQRNKFIQRRKQETAISFAMNIS